MFPGPCGVSLTTLQGGMKEDIIAFSVNRFSISLFHYANLICKVG